MRLILHHGRWMPLYQRAVWGVLWILIAASGAAAQDTIQAASGVQCSRLGVARGMRQYASNSWGVVGVELTNTGDRAAEVLATFRTPGIPHVEFARRIALPPRCVRRTWVPVRVPQMPRQAETVPYLGKLIDTSSDPEVVLRSAQQEVERRIDLRLNHELPVTGILLDEDEGSVSEAASFSYEAVIALRTARGCSRRLVMISGRHHPPTQQTFDGLDQLVLDNDRFATDAALMSAIRGWVHAGGQLWIMLDRLEFEGVERLLGGAFSCGLIDRVLLDTVHIQSTDPRPSIQYTPARQFEQPVEFVRVATRDMEMTHTVDGWPAAFWRSVGRGRVVFTTVGAKAWIQPPQQYRGRWNPDEMTDFVPTPQLDDLPLLLPELPRSYSPEAFQPYLAEQIGYRVASRRLVLTVLGLFCGLLLGAGLYLARVRRLDHLGWLVPVAAMLAALPLVWAGARLRRAVPRTAAQAQLIEVGEMDNEISTSGLLAVYSPQPHNGPWAAEQGGVCELDPTGLQGTVRRMVWTDLGQWRWENLRLPAGVRTGTFERSAVLDRSVRASGTFTKDGFVGRVSGPLTHLEDAIVAVPGQAALATERIGEALRAGPGDVLPRGQYVAGTLLSDEQGRRQEVYARLLDVVPGSSASITGPSLLGWTEPLDQGFLLSDQAERVGAALWSVPLEITRPDSGSEFLIPSPLITSRVVPGPTGHGVSPLFDARTGQWLQSTTSSRIWMRFQIPESLLPVDLQTIRVTLQVTAPDRRLQILRLIDGQAEELFAKVNAIGRYERVLTPPELPRVDDAGGIVLGVAVGEMIDSAAERKKAAWKIDFLRAEVSGRIR